MTKNKCREFNNYSYVKLGIQAQRKYPNEELCRFLGRHFFPSTTEGERKNIKVLEVGAGSCSNLRMVAREGFDAYGVDISEQAISIGEAMLNQWGVSASLHVADMCAMPFNDQSMDVVLDIFSSYSINEQDFQSFINELHRVLKPGGLFFSYTPSSESDAFKNHAPAQKIDPWTLNGIYREDSPYQGNHYPFRFISAEHYRDILTRNRFNILELERVGRTYNSLAEYFEFITVTGQKC